MTDLGKHPSAPSEDAGSGGHGEEGLNRSQRKRLAADRRAAAQAQAARIEARSRRLRSLLLIAGGAVTLVLVVIGIASLGKKTTSIADAAQVANQRAAGITQKGTLFGDADAPVKVVEYADLQCPFCKQFSDDVLGDVLAQQIKTGKASLEFRNWNVIGPDSQRAATASLAAAEQNRMLQFIEIFYSQQQGENTGYVTDEFLDDIAKAAGLDVDRFNADRAKLEDESQRFSEETEKKAVELDLIGTPGFEITGPKGSKTTPLVDATQFGELIDSVS